MDFAKEVVIQYVDQEKGKGFPITSNSPKKKKQSTFTFNCEAHQLFSSEDIKKGKCSACNHQNNYTPMICQDCSTIKKVVFVHKDCLNSHMDQVKRDRMTN